MTTKKKPDVWIAATALCALILRFMCYLQSFKFYFRTDDIVPLSYPAYLAGQDWSTFLSGKMMYYGFGYYWIFAPLFAWVSSPKLLLALIVGFNGLVVALISVLMYHLLVTYMDFPRRPGTVFFALVPAMFLGDVSSRGMYWLRTDNEMPLFLACWLLVWLLLKAHALSTQGHAPLGKRIAVAIGVSAVLCWALTCHERSLALFLSVAVIELFLFAVKRRWLLHPVAFYASLVAGFLAQRMLRRAVIGVMWAGTWPSANTSAFSRVSLWFLESFTAMKALLMILFGNLHSFLIKSFGLPAFAAVIVVVWVMRSMFPKRSGAEDPAAGEAWIDPGVLIMLVFGLCSMVIIGGNSVRWGSLLYPGLASGEVVYGYKGICYSRYYYVFCGPILFGLFAFCQRKREVLRTFARGWLEASWAVWAAVEVVFFAFVFPYCVLADAAEGSNFVRRAIGNYFFTDIDDEKKLVLSMAMMLIAMVLFSIAVIGGRKKAAAGEESATQVSAEGAQKAVEKGAARLNAGRAETLGKALIMTAVFLTAVFLVDRGVQVGRHPDPSLSFAKAAEVSEVLNDLEAEGTLPEKVYLERNVWNYTLRFLSRSVNFARGLPSEEELQEETLIVMGKKSDGGAYLQAGYDSFKVGNYCIYTNAGKTADALTQDLAA